jgi:carboxyl-terminal processing protease
MKIIKLFLIISLFGIFGCDRALLGPNVENTPQANFEALWKDFDAHYGLFLVKKLDWNLSYQTYKPLISATTTDKELYEVFTKMLKPFNDNHIRLIPQKNTGLPSNYISGTLGTIGSMNDFDLDILSGAYLENVVKALTDDEIVYGKIKGHNIGYIHIASFGNTISDYKKVLDAFIGTYKNADGIIVDVRAHEGGSDNVSQYIAGRFASKENLFMTMQRRDGPAHDAFGPLIKWYTKPIDETYLGKICLLTNRFTLSAGETFTLAMKVNSTVISIGDTTSGAFSDVVPRELPNGWIYTMSIGDYRDRNGISWEGKGLFPDFLIKNSKLEVLGGVDKVLNKAINYLK